MLGRFEGVLGGSRSSRGEATTTEASAKVRSSETRMLATVLIETSGLMRLSEPVSPQPWHRLSLCIHIVHHVASTFAPQSTEREMRAEKLPTRRGCCVHFSKGSRGGSVASSGAIANVSCFLQACLAPPRRLLFHSWIFLTPDLSLSRYPHQAGSPDITLLGTKVLGVKEQTLTLMNDADDAPRTCPLRSVISSDPGKLSAV